MPVGAERPPTVSLTETAEEMIDTLQEGREGQRREGEGGTGKGGVKTHR